MNINIYLFIAMTLIAIVSMGLNIYLIKKMDRTTDEARRLHRVISNV